MDGLLLKYFVLKPKGTDVYAAASRSAMRAYASMIRTENLDLSNELRELADREALDAMADNP